MAMLIAKLANKLFLELSIKEKIQIPQAWIDPDVDVAGHMTQIKYPATREFIEMMAEAGIEALHTGSLVRDSFREPGYYYYNDLSIFIRDSDQPRFLKMLTDAGYHFVIDVRVK